MSDSGSVEKPEIFEDDVNSLKKTFPARGVAVLASTMFLLALSLVFASTAQAVPMSLTGSSDVIADVVSQGETITITFSEDVELDEIVLAGVYASEVVVVDVGGASMQASGEILKRGVSVDMGGMSVAQLTITKTGWSGDVSVHSIRGGLSVEAASNGGGALSNTGLVAAVPEPSAALLFAVGLTVASASASRRGCASSP